MILSIKDPNFQVLSCQNSMSKPKIVTISIVFDPWTQLILVFHLGSCYWTHLRQKYSSSSGSAFRDLQPPLLELLEPRLCIVWFCCCLFLVEVFLYFNRRINMITKATKSKVTTTPMRIPKTGVNSNGTGDSEKGKKQQM